MSSRLQEFQPFSGASFLHRLSVCTKFECCETGQNPLPLALCFASHHLAPSTTRDGRSIAFAFGSFVPLLRLPSTSPPSLHLPTPPSSSAVSQAARSLHLVNALSWPTSSEETMEGATTSPFPGNWNKTCIAIKDRHLCMSASVKVYAMNMQCIFQCKPLRRSDTDQPRLLSCKEIRDVILAQTHRLPLIHHLSGRFKS